MKKTPEKSDIACGGGFWWNRDGLVYIGWRKSSRAGRLRELAALAALLAAVGLMLVGLVVPQSLGLANNHIIYLAGSALVLAAGIHLFLIISWVRGAWAVAGPGGIKLDGRNLAWSQVRRPRVERVHRQGVMQAALVADVAWKGGPDQPVETTPLVPAGVTDEADLQRLLEEIRRLMATEGGR